MLGTIVNSAAVLVGGLAGLLFKKGLPQRFTDILLKGVALCVLYIGITGALEGKKVLVLILSMVFGALIGEALDLDGKLNKLGDMIGSRFKQREGQTTIAEGFVTTTLLFCVGAMAIVGSLKSGLQGDNEMLFTKALLDGISAVVFASSLGVGVIFTSVSIFIYQGSITLLAQWASTVLTTATIAEMTCVGSMLIIALALNMLGVTKLKVMNFVPAIFLPILFCLFI